MSHFQQPARRPEAELLLCCARTHIGPDTAERVRQLLKEQIDWNHLIEIASYHGTIPLLFWNLSRLSPDDVPKTTLDQLKAAYNAIARWNLSLTGELLKLLSLFRDRGIRALPLKGPALAAAAYGNLSLRQFCDLDILVPKEDMLKAKEVLMSHSYHPKLNLTAGEEAAYLKSHHDYTFVRAKDSVVVDIQWGVTQWSFAFPFDFEHAWKYREVISMAGASVLNIAPEILLLMLCVHGTKHRWEQLKWICDIAQIVDTYREKLDWDRLMDQACTLGGKRMLLLGLSLSSDLLGARLPDALVKKIANNSSVNSLASQVIGRLFGDRSNPNLLVELEEGPFFFWSARERWRDKLAIAWRYFPEYFQRLIVPNNGDKEFLKLPPSLSLGYYLVHPVRLIKDYWSESRRRAADAGK
jgi:Uncharacterised nucleotidyltransferase